MKAMLGIAFLSLVGLAACAGTDTRSTYAEPATVGSEAAATVETERDAQYIARVERLARTRGVQVYWIHPPVKRVASND